MRKFPHLNEGQFAVTMADGATGHVLLESGEISMSETDEIYKVFPSVQPAIDYIQTRQKENDTWEFVLKNHREELIKYFEALRWS